MQQPIKIDRDERDGLSELMAWRILGTGMPRLDREREAGVPDRETLARFRDDSALTVDLGWLGRRGREDLGPADIDRAEHEIRLAPDRLRGVLERALAEVREVPDLALPPESDPRRPYLERGIRTCEQLLGQVERMEDSR